LLLLVRASLLLRRLATGGTVAGAGGAQQGEVDVVAAEPAVGAVNVTGEENKVHKVKNRQ